MLAIPQLLIAEIPHLIDVLVTSLSSVLTITKKISCSINFVFPEPLKTPETLTTRSPRLNSEKVGMMLVVAGPVQTLPL